MPLDTIILLSIICGFVVAGFVWYGWALVENVLTLSRKRGGRPGSGGKSQG